ncbi:MAG: alpha/beta hydrolase, partial [Promethearchaeota archaeon]
MNFKIDNRKKLILISIFFALFLVGTILMFIIPTSVKITYDLTTQTEDGLTISFNVFEPINGNPVKKAIICGHGVMDNKEWMKSYAIEFAAAGFVAVALDFRGHGLSSGKLIWNDLIKDVRAIKNYLSTRGDIDMNNLGYIGFSMGGYPGNSIVKIDPAFKCYIGSGTILNITREELGPNRTLNILMLQAKFDEVFPLKQTKNKMGRLLNISPDEVVCNRLYGSFQEGNASMIFYDDNSDHVFLPWDQDSVREARDWVLNTFPDVKPVDPEFYEI